MADYNALKVTELKEELKKRSIPTTNLTRKQQIIDRLIEDDNENTGTKDEGAAQEDAKIEASAQQDSAEKAPQDPEGDAQQDSTLQPATTEEPSSEQVQDESTVEKQQSEMELDQDVTNGHAASEPSADVKEILESAEPVAEEPAALQIDQSLSGSQREQNVETAPAQHPVEKFTPLDPVTQEHIAAGTSDKQEGQEDVTDGTPDNRKRKRRSVTPPVREESINKKLKQVDEEHGNVAQLEKEKDETSTLVNGTAQPSEERLVEMADAPLDTPDATVQPMATSDDVMQISTTEPTEPTTEGTSDAPIRRDSDATQNKATRSPNQRRFKDMLTRPVSSAQDVTQSAVDDDVEVSPALHPATRALYVRELLRPININALKDHLEQLATPPGQSASGSLVEECYVDTLKTHAFVIFDSISAASRARASLHARVWPSEAQRKPLWVDFIPEERMSAWIEQERAEGGGRASTAKRWEVAYDVLDDKVDVSLVEASAAGQSRPSFAQGMPGAPLGPRGSLPGPHRSSFSQADRRRPSQPLASQRPTAKAVEEASASFLELDKLFKFTTAKPKLYWQPVSEETADKRLDEIDRETSRDWDPKKDAQINGSGLGRGLDQLKRYTFEDGDVLVDGGPEFGGGAAFGVGRGGESYRGGGGRGGGRRGADRYR